MTPTGKLQQAQTPRKRSTGRRAIQAVSLALLIPLVLLLAWQFDYNEGISLWEGAGLGAVSVLALVYAVASARSRPLNGWERLEREHRTARRARQSR